MINQRKQRVGEDENSTSPIHKLDLLYRGHLQVPYRPVGEVHRPNPSSSRGHWILVSHVQMLELVIEIFSLTDKCTSLIGDFLWPDGQIWLLYMWSFSLGAMGVQRSQALPGFDGLFIIPNSSLKTISQVNIPFTSNRQFGAQMEKTHASIG